MADEAPRTANEERQAGPAVVARAGLGSSFADFLHETGDFDMAAEAAALDVCAWLR
jgi:hypothetical protein